MSITDELRDWMRARGMMAKETFDQLAAIADSIDREHRMALEKVAAEVDALPMTDESMAEHGWIRLPLDADGVPIRIGDVVTCGATVWTVTRMKLLGEGWGICCTVYNECGGSGTNVYPPSDLRHYHEPTVEDVLREFASNIADVLGGDDFKLDDNDELYAEYAAKLRLAEVVDE